MQSLPVLIAEMRLLGVKRLELELEPAAVEALPDAVPEAVPTEPKPEGSCAFGDCLKPREGLMGGAVAPQLCREHALQSAGVKL